MTNATAPSATGGPAPSDNPAGGPDGWRPAPVPDGAAADWETVDPLSARTDGVAVFWHIILGITLLFLLLTAIGNLLVPFMDIDLEDASVTTAALYVNAALLLVSMGLIPLLWVRFTRVGGATATGEYLNMQWQKLPRGLLEGTGWTVVCFVIAAVSVYGYTALFGEAEASPVLEELFDSLDWFLVVFISFAAGFGEEILFRGLLQRWFGKAFAKMGAAPRVAMGIAIVLQGLLFAVFHLGYGTTLNFLVPLFLGLLFGVLYAWRRNLWIVIVAHFLYDLVLLSVAMLFPEMV
jgi:membrane protease YdiL (CAAX protease family)